MQQPVKTAIDENAKKSSGKRTCNPHIPGCIRRLSNDERKFLWSPIPNICVIARIFGTLSKSDLLRALETVRSIHPLVGARVVIDEHHDAWFTNNAVPPTQFRWVERVSETQWFDEVRNEHDRPLEPEKGPLIRFVLVTSPEVSELIVFAAHTICDGTALANLIRDILICYTDPLRHSEIIQPPLITDYLPEKSRFSLVEILKNALIHHWNRQWRKKPHYFGQADFCAVHAAYWEKYRYQCVLLELGREATDDLTSRCRQSGVTITSAMTAAFLAAYEDVTGPLSTKDRSVAIPFDLRRHLGTKEDFFCFFVGGFQFHFVYNLKVPFWGNVQELHRIISRRVKCLDNSSPVMGMEAFDPALLDAFIGFAGYLLLAPDALTRTEAIKIFARDPRNVAWNLARGMGSQMGGTIMTNLGRLEFPEIYGSLRLDRIFVAPCASETVPLILAGAGVSGTLTFTVNFVERKDGTSRITSREMIRVRNRALEYLGFPEKVSDKALE